MARSFSLISLVIVVAAGGYFYSRQALPISSVAGNAKTTVDVIAVHNDLLALASAERRFFALRARYGTMAELHDETGIFIPTRPDYTYSVEASDTTFRIIATHSGPDPKAPVRLTIDDTLNLQETQP